MLLQEISYFHFWMGSTSIIRSKSVLNTRIILLSPTHGGPFPTGSFHLACVIPLPTFQREVLSIFVDLVYDLVDIYMDGFTPYGDAF